MRKQPVQASSNSYTYCHAHKCNVTYHMSFWPLH